MTRFKELCMDSSRSGAALGIAPLRCYDDYATMMAREAALPG